LSWITRANLLAPFAQAIRTELRASATEFDGRPQLL
jgi:hypothetical protein